MSAGVLSGKSTWTYLYCSGGNVEISHERTNSFSPGIFPLAICVIAWHMQKLRSIHRLRKKFERGQGLPRPLVYKQSKTRVVKLIAHFTNLVDFELKSNEKQYTSNAFLTHKVVVEHVELILRSLRGLRAGPWLTAHRPLQVRGPQSTTFHET